ncbi:putative transmembrane protein. polysaccharide export protein [Tenacibaculum sp. 190524A02b]|uniref:Transmembrane protein. polysaccharide export protein n=1 Tax=Tenacibaculum vairaonense TaxID=3137860 RepID=A0ABP1F5M6_9FLAO
MLNKVKALLQKYKSLLSNLGYLTVIKSFNLILPLVIFPYLLRVLGAEKYGLVVFAESIITYMVILVGFGFGLSATKELSINRDHKEKVNELVSSVYIIKGVIFLLCVILFFLMLPFFSEYVKHKLLFLITMHLVLYEFLFPFWYFQGVEKMKYITYLELIGKITFIGLILFYIKSPEDYLLVPAFQGIGSFISIIGGFYIMFYYEKVKFIIPSTSIIKKNAKESLLYFTSTLSIQVFANSNRFFIGSYIGMTSLAHYDIVAKIIKILSVPTTLLRTILIPFVAKNKDKRVIRNVTKIMFVASIFIIGFIFLWARDIVYTITHKYEEDIIYFLKIYTFIILLYNLSNYYLVVGLNSFGHEKVFMKIMVYSMLLYLFLIVIVILNSLFFVECFIISLIMVELFIVFKTYYEGYKRKIL